MIVAAYPYCASIFWSSDSTAHFLSTKTISGKAAVGDVVNSGADKERNKAYNRKMMNADGDMEQRK